MKDLLQISSIVIVLISKLKNTIPFLSVSGMSRIRFRDFDRVRDFEKIVWLKTESQKIRRHFMHVSAQHRVVLK